MSKPLPQLYNKRRKVFVNKGKKPEVFFFFFLMKRWSGKDCDRGKTGMTWIVSRSDFGETLKTVCF